MERWQLEDSSTSIDSIHCGCVDLDSHQNVSSPPWLFQGLIQYVQLIDGVAKMNSYLKNSVHDVFFSGISCYAFFDMLHKDIKSEIESLSDSDILSQDLQELTIFFVDKYTLDPITLLEANIERKLCETKVKKPNLFRSEPYEKEYLEEIGVRVTFTIPFNGVADLFFLKPATYISSTLTVTNFVAPKDDRYGSFSVSLEFTYEE